MNRPMVFAAAGTIMLLAFVAAVRPAAAQKGSPGLRASAMAPLNNCGNGNGNGNGNPNCGGGNSTTITGLFASPGLISFNATSPGLPIPGSSNAAVSFTIGGGSKGNTWTVSAGTTSTTFPGCVTVPASAVTLRCSSASASGGGGNPGSAACNIGNFTRLPSSLPGMTVASGLEPQRQSANFNIALAYQLADSWQYIPNICPLSITYTVNAP